MLKTVKIAPKKDVFGHFYKSQSVKLAKYYLESTHRQYWMIILFYFHWKALYLTYFLVYWKFLLYHYGTIVCPFIVILKHKWEPKPIKPRAPARATTAAQPQLQPQLQPRQYKQPPPLTLPLLPRSCKTACFEKPQEKINKIKV